MAINSKGVRAFEQHGLEIKNTNGGINYSGLCPFCGDSKFYLNAETLQWDCKKGSCARSGNFNSFLSQIAEITITDTDAKHYKRLAKLKGISWKALQTSLIGYDGEQWLIPIQSLNGKGCIDIRLWKEKGGKVMSTSNGSLGIYNVQQLIDPELIDHDVFVTEGEFDAIALNWMLHKAKRKAIAISVPGASVFKASWASLFQKRNVFVLFDNDDAGTKGMQRIQKLLKNENCNSLQFIHWNKELKKGYDIRDLCQETKQKAGRHCHPDYFIAALNQLSKGFKALPVGVEEELQQGQSKAVNKNYDGIDPIPHAQVFAGFKEWLNLRNSDALLAIFGTVIANRIAGDPLWLFLVGPPSSGKTELLMSMSDSPEISMLSTLTPAALISGQFEGTGPDPSLLPQLNDKVLCIKDFTAILGLNPLARDEMFGLFRDSYDGSIVKLFGNGVRRAYTVHYGLIAGVTNAIDKYSSVLSALGERFLKFRIPNPTSKVEHEIITQALSMIGSENTMKEDLRRLGLGALAGRSIDPLPTMSNKVKQQLIAMSQLAARMRGSIDRDNYKEGLLHSLPSREIGVRLAKQLAKLAMGIAIYLQCDYIPDRAIKICRKVAMDSVPAKRKKIVRELLRSKEDYLTQKQLEAQTKLPNTTLRRMIEDCELLELINKEKLSAGRFSLQLTASTKRLLKGAGYA